MHRTFSEGPFSQPPSFARPSLADFVEAAVERLRSGKEPLPAMGYFHDLAGKILRPPLLEKAKKEGRKVIGFYCAIVPQELIAAFDAVPIRLCSGLPASGHHGLPRDCCPVVTSSCAFLGSEGTSLLPDVDAVIVPAVCDWKSQFAEVISPHLPTFKLQVPPNKREASAHHERLRSLSLLTRFLEELTGRQFSRQKLLRSIKTYQKANYATRRLADSMLEEHSPIRGSDLLLAMNVSFFDDILSWTNAVMRLLAEVAERRPANHIASKPATRLLLTGAPIIWPNWKVPEIIEEEGGVIAAEELCSGARIFYDPVKIDEPTTDDMLRALAERYSLACTCPCFVPNDDRLFRNISLARRYRVDGVIYHNLRTCYLYHAEARIFRRKFRELAIPFLEIETDYSLEDHEQLAVRIEPFIEMLRGAK
ncbi:2-hydroxyacyl-CoA dehydratase [bacterium]|nr:2-hydroxyacyl-CoA dehydratase [bacterium]